MSQEWKLVPVEPTEEMLSAVVKSTFLLLREECLKMARDEYIAMVSAAPSLTVEDFDSSPDGVKLEVFEIVCRERDHFKAMLAAVPVPPAGGELEVVGWRDDGGRCITHGGSGRYSDPLVRLEDHRVHVALLQAELESERKLRRELGSRVHELKDKAKDLQSELTKARELLTACVNRLDIANSGFPGSVPFLPELRAFLANQSAPAAKGEGDDV